MQARLHNMLEDGMLTDVAYALNTEKRVSYNVHDNFDANNLKNYNIQSC